MEEAELLFKRFPAEKQDQVRGLVEYATLMGLTGKDLVSIGGKLDRIKAQKERARNMEIIKSFKIDTIGDDKRYKGINRESALDNRFKIRTATGAYNFQYSYYGWEVQSLKTGVGVRHKIDIYAYELGDRNWSRLCRYAMMLDVAHGKIQLNF